MRAFSTWLSRPTSEVCRGGIGVHDHGLGSKRARKANSGVEVTACVGAKIITYYSVDAW